MYAIFAHSGKQYYVTKGQTVRLEKININPGQNIQFNNIIMIVKNQEIIINPTSLINSHILGNIISQGKDKKINIIKFKRRKHYKKKQGHRQSFTEVKIIDIKIK